MRLNKISQGRSTSWVCRTGDELYIIDKLPDQSFRVNATELITTKFTTLEEALNAIQELNK